MPRTKPILRFLLFVVAIYALVLVLAAVMGFDHTYAKGFAASGKVLLERVGRNGTVWFEAKPKEEGKMAEVKVTLLNQDQIDAAKAAARSQGGGRTVKVKSAPYKIETWVYGFLPTVLVIALILASPVPWQRRLLALVLGLLLFHLYLWFKTYIELLYLFNQDGSSFLQAATLSPFWFGAVDRLHAVFFSISFNMIMAAFVWALVTFRKEDWSRLLR